MEEVPRNQRYEYATVCPTQSKHVLTFGLTGHSIGPSQHIQVVSSWNIMRDPSSASGLYAALDRSEIRILDLSRSTADGSISGDIKTISIDRIRENKVAALSYSWGRSDQEQRQIRLNDRHISIRQNLFEALEHLLTEEPWSFWIDALCINQEDATEKAGQLALMSRIYSEADTVQVWLGPSPTTPHTLDMLLKKEIPTFNQAFGGEATPRGEVVMSGVLEIISRPWFGRVWVIQELVLSASGRAFANLGQTRISWDEFADGLNWLDSSEFEEWLEREKPKPGGEVEFWRLKTRLLDAKLNVGAHIRSLCGLRSAYLHRRERGKLNFGDGIGFSRCLLLCRGAAATETCDKVIGLCGFLDEPMVEVLVESKEIGLDELFAQATRHVLKDSGSLRLWQSFPTKTSHKTPSWTLDFTYQSQLYLEYINNAPFEASPVVEVPSKGKIKLSEDGKRIIVDGRIMDTIHSVLYPDFDFAPRNREDWLRFWGMLLQIVSPVEFGVYVAHRNLFGGHEEQVHRWQDANDNYIPGLESHVRTLFLTFAFVEFLQRAAQCLRRHPVAWDGQSAITFMSKIGLSTPRRRTPPNELDKELGILLGRGDRTLGPETPQSLLYNKLADVECARRQSEKNGKEIGDPNLTLAVAVERFNRAPILGQHLFQAFTGVSASSVTSLPLIWGIFTTKKGLAGLCPRQVVGKSPAKEPGKMDKAKGGVGNTVGGSEQTGDDEARIGDHVAMLDNGDSDEYPFLLRRLGDHGGNRYSMVTAISVSQDWQEMGGKVESGRVCGEIQIE
jgi:hypothetical protein